MATRTDDRITKRKVTMRSVSLAPPDVKGPNGEPVYQTWEKVDYVRPDYLPAYLEVARGLWQAVEVSEEPDAGPAGFDGATYVPATYPTIVGQNPDGTRITEERPFPHPLAGTYFPATDCGPDCSHAPEGARVVVVGQEG